MNLKRQSIPIAIANRISVTLCLCVKTRFISPKYITFRQMFSSAQLSEQ